MPDRDVEQKRLDLDRERLNLEQEKWREDSPSRRSSTVGHGAAVAGLLNVVVAYVNGSSQRELEK
jgi:hypothetical protein